MKDCDVHHNPARHEGGRNIPEHLFVYHNTLHTAVHGDTLVAFAREGGRLGGLACWKKGVGAHDPKIRSSCGKKGGQTNAKNKTGVCGRSPEKMADDGRKGGRAAFDRKVGVFATENLGRGGKNVPKEKQIARGKKAAETNRKNKTAFFDSAVQRQGSLAAHQEKDEEGKSIHAKRLGNLTTSQRWEDPDHPELGARNAGNLVQLQKRKGLPHSKENRRRIK
jgi:general stress protein YciG